MLIAAFVLGGAAGAAPAEAHTAAAADAPLGALPYTPSLDPAAMDRSADPCEDFYRYACGGWRARNPIPADQASWSVYGKLYQDNQRFLWGILQELAARPDGRSPAQQKIGDYFAACMDETAIARRGLAPLAPLLMRIEGLTSRRELPGVVADAQLQSSGADFLFGFGSNQDYADSSRVIAFAQAGGLGLPDRDYYTDRDAHARTLRTQYREHVARMFVLLGDAPDVASRNAATVLALETRLAAASLQRADLRDPHKLFHLYSVADLQRLTPDFNWTEFLAGMGIAGTAEINVTEPKFYAEMGRLLKSAPLADLKTYLRWHAVHAAARFLPPAIDDEHFAFYGHVLRGVAQQEPRWKRCVGLADTLLGTRWARSTSPGPSGRS